MSKKRVKKKIKKISSHVKAVVTHPYFKKAIRIAAEMYFKKEMNKYQLR